MSPTIYLRIKIPDVKIPLLHIEYEIRAAKYNSLAEECYVGFGSSTSKILNFYNISI